MAVVQIAEGKATMVGAGLPNWWVERSFGAEAVFVMFPNHQSPSLVSDKKRIPTERSEGLKRLNYCSVDTRS